MVSLQYMNESIVFFPNYTPTFEKNEGSDQLMPADRDLHFLI